MTKVFAGRPVQVRRVYLGLHAASLGFMLLGIFGATSPASPQGTGGAAPAFDVASFKRAEIGPDQGPVRIGRSENYGEGKFGCRYCVLINLIEWAFSVKEQQISGPDWFEDDLYSIDARMPPGTSKEQVLLMVQNLLVTRLHLTFHREERELRIYALVVSDKGAKLRPAKADSTSDTRPGDSSIVSNKLSTTGLARLLARYVDRPVLDKTNIPGLYEVNLKWMPDPVFNRQIEGEPDAPNTVSMFTALRDQLGLRLKADRARLEFLVIDHADRIPSEE